GDLKQRVAVSSADEIGELARAFNSMAVGLEHQEQLRRDMVSDVAHELRTPLTNIRCQLESVADGLAQPSPELLASMQEEVLHLSRLVDDLRDLALADAGQLSLHLEPVSIASAVENVVAALQPRIQSARITISQHVPADLPSAHADAMRLGQILRNLLENALAHTPQGGSIFIEARALEKSVRVEIRDTGSGVSPEHLPHIFDRFYRTDPSRSRETGGAGLGLAIVKQLVTAMDGTVSAESAPGKGSTFRIEFPCAQ
ncbi:MAG: HAMP domain-containing protein, partial [Acidobacteria bacterium]|nr:HAMP domain-containing protein [Acidobacteriota bacterium]